MEVTLYPVETMRDLRRFVTFPWMIYRNDPYWVPPLVEERIERLDTARNPFWRSAERALWIAWGGGAPVGTIAAIIDHHRIRSTGESVGLFGFFESVADEGAACKLFEQAARWLRERGMTVMRGPYNPGTGNEFGILVEGFDTRPAVLEAHNPLYYPALMEAAGFDVFQEAYARRFTRTPQMQRIEDALPEKVRRAAERAGKRADLRIRTIDMKCWDEELDRAAAVYNEALASLPGNVSMPVEEFRAFAESFKPILDPDMGMIAEIGGKWAGFALVLPDINEALQKVNGRLGLAGKVKLWWYSRFLSRASFKILVVLPQYQYRGVEALLVQAVSRAIWRAGYREVDMSMTGDENWKSNRFQDHLGFPIYRRYCVYQKGLVANEGPASSVLTQAAA